MNQIRWGVLSTARIGKNQVIPAIQQSANGVVAAVASRDIERGKDFAAQLNIPKVYGSYEALIADPDIDAIYNPLPNSLHAEWSIRCAEGGKHVLCEKPLASTPQESQQMADVFRSKGLLLAEAFMYRFHPQTQTIKRMLDEGAVGKVQIMQATFNFSIGSESDIRLNADLAGGALMDVGCYCVDVMRYMTGEEPEKVQALGVFKDDVDQSLAGVLMFPSGALGHFDCSLRTQFTQTYEIRGTEGRIYVERGFVPFRPDPNLNPVIRYWKGAPGSEGADYQEIEIPRVNQYTLMVEDFAASILQNRPLRFPIEESIAQMRVLERLYQSARG